MLKHRIKEGKTEPGFASALAALGIEVTFDIRKRRYAVLLHGRWQDISNPIRAQLTAMLAASCVYEKADGEEAPFRISLALLNQFLDFMMYKNETDFFADWLESLPDWDGTPRLDTWTVDLFGADDTPLNRFAAKAPWLQAVARTLEAGVKSDEVVTLCGDEGMAKSTFFQWMLPPVLRARMFTDGFVFSDNQQRMIEACLGKVIVECAEMIGVTKADKAHIKAFTARSYDNSVRLAYRPDPEDVDRTFILVATTNPNRGGILPNDEINRRFIVVECKKSVGVRAVRKWLDDHREQCWAEALHRIRAGEQHWVPDDLKPAQAAVNKMHRSGDALLRDSAAEYLSQQRDAFVLGECLEAIGLCESWTDAVKVHPRSRQAATDELSALGAYQCHKRSCKALMRRHWHPPLNASKPKRKKQ